MERRDSTKNPVQSDIVEGLVFLHQQDGVPERELTSNLARALPTSVQRAYLARVERSDTKGSTVALCLAATGSHEPLVLLIGAVFAKMFASSQHLDIIFLSSEQEQQLARVCQPFLHRAG